MFGQKDDDQPDQNTDIPEETIQAVSSEVDQPQSVPQTIEPTPVSGEGVADPAPIASAATAPAVSDDLSWKHLGAPTDNGANDTARDVFSPAGGYPSAPSGRITTDGADSIITYTADDTSAAQADNSSDNSDNANEELVEIKQKALNELMPLIDQLDQPPEEKFRTIMMMIQASDNEGLVEKAYEAAHSIEDESARAQALLDIVNEINYFTQPHNQAETSKTSAPAS